MQMMSCDSCSAWRHIQQRSNLISIIYEKDTLCKIQMLATKQSPTIIYANLLFECIPLF